MIQNRSWTTVVLAAVVASFISACGGEESGVPCGEEPIEEQAAAAPAVAQPAADAAAKADNSPAVAAGSWTSLDDEALVKFGERIFLAKGSNTCNDGDADKINTALTYLISNGGKKFNGNFETDYPDLGWDWAKTEATSYDIQMFGVTQSSTLSEIKKIRKDLKKQGVTMEKSDMTAFGTKAVLRYLQAIEVQ